MSRNLITVSALLATVSSAALAGGIERNAPTTRILFEEGRYLEFSASSVNPTLSGSGGDATAVGGPPNAAPNGTGDLLESYFTLGAGYKADINENLSYAIIIDEPHGVDTNYPSVAGSIYSGVVATLDARQLSAILSYDVNDNVKVYGGLRAESVKAQADLPFIGAAAGGYSINASSDTSFGYMAGVAYSRPEIALRVALTYYSDIDHVLPTSETIPLLGTTNDTVDIKTPQSVNLEFQSGVAEDTLVFGSIRWVDWSEFAITPTLYSSPGVTGRPLVDYEKDWTTYTLGVGRRFNDQWSGAFQISHEPATDVLPLTTLGPVDGRTAYTLAGTYTMDKVKITTGLSYVDLGGTANLVDTSFDGGDAIAIGVRVGYSF